jgi:hypothetical protein
MAVNNLQLTNQSQQQIYLRFIYQTAVFSISQFLLCVADMSLNQGGYAVIEASTQSSISGSNYTYNFILNPATVFLPQFQTSHAMMIRYSQ